MHVVELDVEQGNEDELVDSYHRVFAPAISAQPGFRTVRLLKPADGFRWLLLIEFATERDRVNWVATPQHQRAWPVLGRLCSSASGTNFEDA